MAGRRGADAGAAADAREPELSDGAEVAAHALLRLVADHPGQNGRVRAGRIIGGFAVPHRDAAEADRMRAYAVRIDWTLRETTDLVDAMIAGGLIVQTPGPRPVLVLTRPGFRALEALEGVRAPWGGAVPFAGASAPGA
jgi:hypothetical protein